MTFLEISGEDLVDIDVSVNNDTNPVFSKELVEYLKQSSACIIVSSCENASEDDYLIDQFFEWLDYFKVKCPIALVISKWDMNKSMLDNPVEFVEIHMKQTDKWLESMGPKEHSIFSFSIGSCKEEGGTYLISEIDLSDAGKIAAWIGECVL